LKIYTKRGDLGETDLIGKRTLKSDVIIELVGQIDEACVRIAYCKHEINHQEVLDELSSINNHLFTISSALVDVNHRLNLSISDQSVASLEMKIDQIEASLVPLKNFITYDGTLAAIHISSLRSQIRSIERLLVKVEANKEMIRYVNRLSDYLFVLMRQINKEAGNKEKKLETIK